MQRISSFATCGSASLSSILKLFRLAVPVGFPLWPGFHR
jgi:hypothetical protein